jgi:manganese transport protein
MGIQKLIGKRPHPNKAAGFLKYVGPGLLVTVGFIDPGNWASNIAAGSKYGYTLLWMVTLSTIMLVVLQHNAAHLGIVTGKCLSEAATEYMRPWSRSIVLFSAVGAAISTALAEIMGAGIALNMLFHLPIKVGSLLTLVVVLVLQFTNSYQKIEKIIIGFVSLIGLSFLFEIYLIHTDWPAAAAGWVTPAFPQGSMVVIMSVLGAVVMPHNLFLHSEIIQSRQWNLQDEVVIKKQLKYEFTDTLLSMIVGWGINSAMILMAAATFFTQHTVVNDLAQAQEMLKPLVGDAAGLVFAIALLFSGLSSSITAGMAGGSIFAGIFGEPYNLKDNHSRLGVLITMVPAMLIILLIASPFDGLIYSQMLLSIQLPFTIFTLIYLTSSKKVMGRHANGTRLKILLWGIGLIVTFLNVSLLLSYL